ncbi:MAG TPA: DUF402 domain-containing protein [Thermomicrobiales bacterium]|nr:DUF402 domain-containing protein [Thermomicrobiales bacterium]
MRTDRITIEDRPEAKLWGIDGPTLDRWPTLVPGREVTVVKHSVMHGPDFRVAYPGTVVTTAVPAPWVEIQAFWVAGTVQQAHLTFEIDDVLREIFSPIHPYNAFAVYSPAGELKGWYANVVYPTVVTASGEQLEVVWNDLFIDIVVTPDGEVAVLDEEELEEAELLTNDPELHARILVARGELLRRCQARRTPFSSPNQIDVADYR